MNETFKSFSDGILQVMHTYWQRFLFLLPRLLLAIVVLVIVFFVAHKISQLLNNRLNDKAHDPLFARFVSKITRYALIIAGIMIVLQILGLSGIAGGLLAGAGISAFIFGFAFKDIAENFLAGMILAFDRPFALNDSIKILEYVGHVEALNFRTTHIKTFDEKDVFIPNSTIIKEPLTNLTKNGLIRIDFEVGIAYEDDIASAEKAIIDTLLQIPDVLKDKKPFVTVDNLDVSTVNLKVFFWTTTDDFRKGVLLARGEVMKKVKEVLTDKGFTMPANIQELKLYDKRKSIPVEILPTTSEKPAS